MTAVAETTSPVRRRRIAGATGLAPGLLLCASCAVGPQYSRPSVPAPPAYREAGAWKAAKPSDHVGRGKWWAVFQDPGLDALEDQITLSNQTLRAAEAQFLQARALIRFDRAGYFPTATLAPSAARSRLSANRPLSSSPSPVTNNDFVLPFDVSYEADVWGRVRRSVAARRADAQASAADLEAVRLSLAAELAVDYFELRGLDAEEELLHSTARGYERALELTRSRYQGGIASQVDVAQAEAQLEATRAQAIDVGVQRSQLEHAIATLTGQAASGFSLPPSPPHRAPPSTPVGVPSELLERRPDIAAAERRMAAACERIGVAKAAYFPTVTLTASRGFESRALGVLLSGPSALWSVAGGALQTIFDAGRRRATSEQAREAYNQAVASYRQTVLTGFQEVEDNLAALRILEEEAKIQDAAVTAAQRSLELSTNRYKGGVVSYLEVITAQSTALADERLAVGILRRRMTASILLVKALGGGWDASRLVPAPPPVAQLRPAS
jgi:NodT family efflux transporter outer membrane factor (OMF) lipoprotein